MINPENFFLRTRQLIHILIPVGIALYIIYPLLSGDYFYPFAEYELLKSFMINFIDTLRNAELPQWNDYVGCGQPAVTFGHYPISQNTIFYMIFGYSDFTYFFTRFTGLATLFLVFIYACKFLKLSYFYALIGSLVYFCVNFVVRSIIMETVGNLYPIFPLLFVLVIYIVSDKSFIRKREVVIFSLFYILWLSGGHLTYELMPLVMLSIVYWIAIFIFHYKSLKLVDFTRFTGLYFILFVVPLSAVLYQYYFIYDVISDSNRFKPGLIVSPFESIAWKQLLLSFHSSSYFWVGLFCCIIYAIVSFLPKKCDSDLLTKKEKIPSPLLLLLIPFLFIVSGLVDIKMPGNNIVANGEISENIHAVKSYKSSLQSVPNGQTGNCLKITTAENSIGYAYFAVPTQVGKKYKFTAYYKKGSAPNGQIKIGTSIDVTDLYYSGVLSNSNWIPYSCEFRAPNKVTYITLVNLTSTKEQSSFFDTITLKKLEPLLIADSDYVSILKSTVFKIAFTLYIVLVFLAFCKKKIFTLEISFSALLNYAFVFIAYMSLLSYYFFSPENIIGDANGYDYDLFRELSPTLQIIFCLVVLYSIEGYQKRKVVKIIVLSLIVLYLIRSHFTIPLMRFTGIVWYATRDGTIYSLFFAVLFMFGLRNIMFHLTGFIKFRKTANYIKYGILFLLIVLLVRDSYNKFYKGTSHRFIYVKNEELVRPEVPMDQGALDAHKEVVLLKERLLTLDKETDHYYRMFAPGNNYFYLEGSLQDHKMYEAFIYDSSITKELQDFYEFTILNKKPVNTRKLKDAMPYFLFTRHVHAGINLTHREIPYGDFFMFAPNDTKYIKEQNIEFLWDIMQVKYIIIDAALSKVLDSFATREQHYNLLDRYPKLGLNLYEITKEKKYSRLAILPVDDGESHDQMMENINSKDIEILKHLYSKLVFLDKHTKDFTLLKNKRVNSKRFYEIKSERSGILIEFESWNKNWELERNDKKENVLKAFQMFKGIKIEPGLNKIEISYGLKLFNLLFFFSIFVILAYVTLLVKYHYSEKNAILASENINHEKDRLG